MEEKQNKVKTFDVVFNHIKKKDEPLKVKGLKDALKLTAGQVAGAIHRLEKERKIKRIGRGAYELIKDVDF